MTRQEKIKKVIAIAVAYYIDQEKTALNAQTSGRSGKQWNKAGKAFQMNMKKLMQQRGSLS
ncbi:MAG: hypothetical protein JJU28_16245 [Cyclobacteriaceae bacterium]|nr:hypothetical protein [Cyclobacteriaceae bacterium]